MHQRLAVTYAIVIIGSIACTILSPYAWPSFYIIEGSTIEMRL